MITVEFEIDAQSAGKESIAAILCEGTLVSASCLYNDHWEDDSAVRLADQVDLKVDFNVADDDTPGTIYLTVHYASESLNKIRRRLSDHAGIMSIDAASGLWIAS